MVNIMEYCLYSKNVCTVVWLPEVPMPSAREKLAIKKLTTFDNFMEIWNKCIIYGKYHDIF